MKLLTETIKAKLPKLYATEKIKTKDKKFVCRFFDPIGNWSWLVAEGEKQEDGDWLFFGLVDGFEKEWGYFSLSELESVELPLGLRIERDTNFGKISDHPEWTREED